MAPGRSLLESSWKEAFRLNEEFTVRTSWKEPFRVTDSGLGLPSLDSRKEDFSTRDRDSALVRLLEGQKEISASGGGLSGTLLVEAFRVDEPSAFRMNGRGFNLSESGFVLSTALELLAIRGSARKNPLSEQLKTGNSGISILANSWDAVRLGGAGHTGSSCRGAVDFVGVR